MLRPVIAVGVVGVVLLVLLNAVFVAAEFALVAVERAAVEIRAADGDRRAGRTLEVLRRLNLHLSGAQFGITVCSLGLGVLAEPVVAPLFEPLLGRWLTTARSVPLSVLVALLVTTFVQMVVGELVPKSVAVSRPLAAADALAGPIRAFTFVVGPVVRGCNRVADAIVRLLGSEPTEELAVVRSREELRDLVASSAAHATLDREDSALLARTFRFEDKTAADALTPRVDVRWLPEGATSGDLLDLSAETGLSRFPVCRRSVDDVVAVLDVRAVLRSSSPPDGRRTIPLVDLYSEVVRVPESKRLPDLFAAMQSELGEFVVVVDEYGGTAGVITLEDIVEEVVGEIDDEHDPLRLRPRPDASGRIVLSGQLHPDEVQEACGLELPEGEYETLAGFVLDRLGRIPSVGDAVHHDGWTLTVARMARRRVDRVRVQRPDGAAAAADDGGAP